MKLLGSKFEIKIEDILKLKKQSCMICYGMSEIKMFDSVSNLYAYNLNLETAEKLTESSVIKDLTNDGRSRSLKILNYDNVPFALYQYIGRGNVENEVIFDKEVYLKFLSDYMKEYLEKTKDIEEVDKDSFYQVENYDFGVFYEKDGGIESICKTKLGELGLE